jgi:hypothetical protein
MPCRDHPLAKSSDLTTRLRSNLAPPKLAQFAGTSFQLPSKSWTYAARLRVNEVGAGPISGTSVVFSAALSL